MKLADLKKELKVVATQKGYYIDRIINEGEAFKVPRLSFSHEWMVAVDKNGSELEEQPERLDKAELKKLLEKESAEGSVASLV